MAAQSLSTRNAAAGAFKQLLRSVTRYKDGGNPSPRLLTNKLDKVTEEKENLMRLHCTYAEKANKELDDDELTNFIDPLMDEADELCDAIYLLLHEDADAAADSAKQRELQIAVRQCQSNEAVLRENITTMRNVIDDENRNTKEDALQIRSQLNQIDDLLGELIKSWNVLKSLSADATRLDEVFNTEETVKKYVSENRLLALTFIEKTNLSSDPPTSNTASVLSESSSLHPQHFLKLEKSKNPTFSGDIRSYARFKSDFEDIVVPAYPNEKHQLYVLKNSCLLGSAKKLVQNMVDMKEIWERLEARYGNNIEIVNAVIKSIQNFKFTKEHDKSIVRLVDELEKGVEDLKAIEAKQDIANAYTVKLLEEKLPRNILKKWLEKEETLTNDDDRFDALMSFLKLKRKQAERILLVQDQKPQKENNDKDNRDSNNRNAFSAGTRTQSNKNNCLIHPDKNHLTRRCNVFRSKSVDERGQIVKDKKACKLCLSTSHPDEPCPFESTWEKCGVNGCQQFHSRMIHGCTIQGVLCFARNFNVQQESNGGGTLLLIEKIRTKNSLHMNSYTITFWDNGSTIALVSKEYCVKNNLHL